MSTSSQRAGTIAIAASAGFIAGVYAVFPAVMAIAARVRPRPVAHDGQLPASVSVVIAAHNEAEVIGRKLNDVAAQSVRNRITIQTIISSDGSTDATVAIARAHPSESTILDLPRGGKAAAMNAAIDLAEGDVVVFTDANSRLGPEVFERLLNPFCDPEVGGVAGDQRYDKGESGTADSEGTYWSFERSLKTWESTVGNVVSATGTLHAIRRELVDEVPGDVTDDFYLSTGVISRGHRLVFAGDAVAWEMPNDSAGAEYRRRVRIITRGLTAVWRRRDLLDPRRHGAYAAVLFVHKVARRLVFVPMVVTLVGSFAAQRRPVVVVGLAGQVAFYALAIIGVIAPKHRFGRQRVVALPAHFCVANAAAAHAVVNLARSKHYVTWTPERA